MAPPAMPGWRDPAIGAALLALLAGAVLAGLTGAQGWHLLTGAALVAFVACAWPRLRPMGRLFALAAVAAAASTAFLPGDPARLIEGGIRLAGLYGGLYVALGFLREAAFGSPMVLRAGQELLRMSPRRRYALLTGGAHVFGLVLNFGVLNLLGTTIRRATPDAGDLPLRRRLLVAILRGFATTPMWSPLSIAPLLSLSHMPSLPWARFAPAGAAAALAMLALGWLFDRLAGRSAPAAPGGEPLAGAVSHRPWEAQARLIALIAGIIAAILAVRAAFGLAQIVAIMVTVPAVALAWIAWQEARRPGAAAAVGRRLRHLGGAGLASSAMEALVLSSAGFVGAIIAGAIDPLALTGLIDALGLPVTALPPLAFCAILAGSMAGLNPILTVTVIGAVIGDPAALGLPPLVMALAFVTAWGVAAGSSPFTASVMIVGRFAEMPAHRAGFGLNGAYSLVAGGAWILFLALLPLAI